MTAEIVSGILTFIVYWAILFAAYCAIIFTLDWLLSIMQRRRAVRRAMHAHIDEINADLRRSVQNLTAAFLIAQAEIRRQTEKEVKRH